MKKMMKMSLAAAVAVAGLTSTASAGNLTEMIKDSKVSGYVRYRLETDHENSTNINEKAKVVAKLTTPVNDMVTANVKVVGGESSTQNADTSANLAVTEGNFVVKAGGATVIAGLQTSQSPFFANNGDTRSHGATALVPAGPATIAAAYYTTTTGGGLAKPAMTNDVVALGAMVKAGPANINLWYAQVEDGDSLSNGGSIAATLDTLNSAFDDASAMSAEVTLKAGPVDLQAMMTQVSNGNSDTGLTKVVASGKAGSIEYAAAYAMTNEDGGMVSLDKDSDAKSDLSMEILNMQATTDASAIYGKVGVKVADNVKVCLSHIMGTDKGTNAKDVDFSETDVHVKYAMSKNFKVTAWYAMGTTHKDADFANSRVEFKYTF
jgi:hypothetical protein